MSFLLDQTHPERPLTQRRVRFFGFMALAGVVGHYVAHLGVIPLLYWLVTLPGTVFHESAHYLAALLLNGHPSGFSIFPTWQNGSVATLGHVMSIPTWYNAATVGMAPLMLFPLAVLLVWKAARSTRARNTAFWFYLSVCAWASCVPSPQDVSVAWSYPISFLFALVFLGVVARLAVALHVRQFRGVTGTTLKN